MDEAIEEHTRLAHETLREHYKQARRAPPDHLAKSWEEMSEGERETHRRTTRFSLMDHQHHPHSVRERQHLMGEPDDGAATHVREADRIHADSVETCRKVLSSQPVVSDDGT